MGIKDYTEKIFENIKHIDEYGNEFWLARELMSILEYTLWHNFYIIIKIAMNNCNNSNYKLSDHFIDVDKMVQIGSNTANSVHYEVAREVRNSIKRLGGTMPEDLPTPNKSLKELEIEQK